MGKKFRKVVPKKPVYRKNMYDIPVSYSRKYLREGVKDSDAQKFLFYGTQFGGFRSKKVPQYLRENPAFQKRWLKSKEEEGFFHFKTNTPFLSKFGKLRVRPLLRARYKTENYDKEFLEAHGFTDGEVLWIAETCDLLNNFYSSQRVGLKVPNSGVTADDILNLTRFNSIPHFQYKPRSGGRLFHSGPGSSYQSLSSSLRPFLTINGEKTTEIDISAATIQFAGNVSTSETYDDSTAKIFRICDPYQHFLDSMNAMGSGEIDRNALKDILYTLVYSKKNSERRNVNRRLKLMGQPFGYSDIETHFPNFFKLLEDVKAVPLPDGENGELFSPHQIIFKEESRYARGVLRRCCLEEGFPVLPLHDSFIAPRSNSSDLERVMKDVSTEYYDYVMSYKRKF